MLYRVIIQVFSCPNDDRFLNQNEKFPKENSSAILSDRSALYGVVAQVFSGPNYDRFAESLDQSIDLEDGVQVFPAENQVVQEKGRTASR